MKGSLRTQLLSGTMLATAVLFVAADLIVYSLVSGYLREGFDRELKSRAHALMPFVEDTGKERRWTGDEALLTELSAAEQGEYLEVWEVGLGGNEKVLYRSTSLDGEDLPRLTTAERSHNFDDVTLEGGRAGRVITLRFFALPPVKEEVDAENEEARRAVKAAAGGGGRTNVSIYLSLARDAGGLQTTLGRIWWILLSVSVGAAVVSAAVLFVLIRRAVRPVAELAGKLSAFPDVERPERIEVVDAPAEIQPVIASLNGLLGRLSGALARERGFSADVAHELRTPLAGVRATIEATLRRPREGGEYAAALADCLVISGQMERLVENLLALARLEAREVRLNFEEVDAGEIVEAGLAAVAGRIAEKRVSVTREIDGGVMLRTDRVLFQAAVKNLLENAVEYVNEGGQMEVEVSAVVLRISNSGSKLTAEEAQLAKQKFWRGDPARAGTHCGLGLALVERIAVTLGLELVVDSAVGREFAAMIKFPTKKS